MAGGSSAGTVVILGSASGAVIAAAVAVALVVSSVLKVFKERDQQAQARRQARRVAELAHTSAESTLAQGTERTVPVRHWWEYPPLARMRHRDFEVLPFLETYPLGQRLKTLFCDAGLQECSETLVQWWLLVALVLLVLPTLSGSFFLGFVLSLTLTVLAVVSLQGRVDKSKQALRAALPDLLDALAQSLRAGLSFPQAVARLTAAAVSEASPALSLLQELNADLALGRGSADSFVRLAKESGLKELHTVAAALGIVARVGGNASLMLEQTAGVIRQDLTLNRSLKAQTAQGRMSVRLVGSVPFVLIALMSLVMPGYLSAWLTSGFGQALFGLALCLLLVGFLWVRKVVSVRV